MQRRDFLRRIRLAAGRRRRRRLAAAEPAARRGGQAARRRSRAPLPAQHADRPLRRADDGEPVVRPLLRLAAERGRRAGPHVPRPGQRQRAGRDPPRLDARDRPVAGLRAPRPRPLAGTTAARSSAARGPNPTPGAGRLPGRRQRRVRALLLRRGRPRLHPPGGPGVHGLRPVPLLADGPDLAEPLLQVVGAVGRQARQHAAGRHARQPVGDGLRPRDRRAGRRPATTTRTCRSRRSGARAARRGHGPWPSTTPTARRARCRTSRSSTRRSATAAAATGSRPTSTRSATCASARRSCPTSSTRSSSRRTGSAARCSSSTTSGAASSTTCARRASPTRAAARTWTTTSGRWASGSRRSRSRPSRSAARSATSCAGSSRSSSLITYRFGLGHLTTRDARAQNIGESMAWTEPNFERPDLPDPDRIVSAPARSAAATCWTASRRTRATWPRSRTSPSASAFATGTGAADQIFREPDSLQKALT